MTRAAGWICFVFLISGFIRCHTQKPLHITNAAKDSKQRHSGDEPNILRGSEIAGLTNGRQQKPAMPTGTETSDQSRPQNEPNLLSGGEIFAFDNRDQPKSTTPAVFKKFHQKRSVNESDILRGSENAGLTNDEQDGQMWTRDVVVHLLGVIEQINLRLESLGSKVECLDKDMNDVKSQVMSTTDNLKSEILAVEQRLTRKVTSEMIHLVDKVELLQYRGAERLTGGEPGRHLSGIEVTEHLAKFSHHITDNFTHAFATIKQGITCGEQISLDGARNTSNDSDSGRQLLETIDEKMANLSASVSEQVKAELQPLISQSFSNLTEATIIQNVESVLQEALMPTKCVKDMVAAPYSVIYPSSNDVITVPYVCDSHTSGGGWIVFQRHQSGSTSFNRKWQDYKHGFGSLTDDFWLGLDAVHNLTRTGEYQLRIDLTAKGQPYFAEYTAFGVASEAENFVLQLGNYSGTAGDSLSYHRWMPFSASDKDNDKSSLNCAADHKSAWWYKGCANAELNYNSLVTAKMYWQTLGGATVTQSEMKLRRVDGKN